ncbi:MAG: iron ABC transporter permease [Hyphomicrobiales bacterium]|nr:iron ABC transporter permease [Hyphomicrobiales bacterium]MCP5373624.1 iron ABC transporter permease [Hyphomicrobiales bacterium]
MTSAPASAAATAVPAPGRRWRVDGWTAGTLLVAALAAAPVAAIAVLALSPSDGIWHHLATTVLPGYVVTSLTLMVGVGLGTAFGGVATAWLVTMYRFPGRRVFEWALLLPLAVPAYVNAYVFTDFLEYAGPLQTALRDVFGWTNRQDYWFPEIRSAGGAIAMMTLVLYPYVYLLARAAFLSQPACVLEVSRTLGKGPWASFFRVALPLARPAIAVGVSLVLMEVLNDFGTVDFFAVNTFTAGIYDVWMNMNSTAGAAQLALVLLLFVVALVLIERHSRRDQRFHQTTTRYKALPTQPLGPAAGALAMVFCALPIALGFVFPAAVLGRYALQHYQVTLEGDFLLHAWHSLALAGTSALVAVAVGLFLAYGARLGGAATRAGVRVASLGYAVPGAVLAVGVIVPMAALDNSVDGFMRATFGIPTGLLLSGTVVAVGYGYLVRFLALSYGAGESGLARVTPAMDGAARTLGATPLGVLRRVHLPMLRGSLLTGGILVFVDCMKELPMTVILRPFNFETLATFVHQYASDELLEECALGALAIVAVGVLPVVFLSRSLRGLRPGGEEAS